MFKKILAYVSIFIVVFFVFFGKNIAVEVCQFVLGEEYYSPPTGYERVADMHSNIAYDALDEHLKVPYKKLLESYLNFDSRVAIKGVGLTDDIGKIYDAVKADYPLLFWVADSCKYEQANFSETFTVKTDIILRRREVNYMLAEVEAAVKVISSGIEPSWSETQKAEYLFNSVVKTITYDSTAERHRDVYSALVENRATCVGYTRAYQLLLAYNGIDSTLVSGSSKHSGIGHALNIVKLDGKYYYSDTTNGELVSSIYDELIEDFKADTVRYGYMFMDSKSLDMTCELDDVQVYGDIECTSTDADYFTRNGLALETADANVVVNTIFDAMQAKVSKSERTFQFRFASRELLLQFYDENLYSGSPFFTTILNRLLNNRGIDNIAVLDLGTNALMVVFVYN